MYPQQMYKDLFIILGFFYLKIGKVYTFFNWERVSAGSESAKLNIERGRYSRPKVPREERICKFCNEVESESHFILFCKT